MNDDYEKNLHSAGATVRHTSPFAHLEVPARLDQPAPDFIAKWVAPFYMQALWRDSSSFVDAVREVAPELNESVAAELLSYFNWRPRIVGAYFVGLKRFTALEELVGHLLLRSDVCDAGRGYCVALARLNSQSAIAFLEAYLDYYLTRPDLWFDQAFAMSALGYLDRQNDTNRRERFGTNWNRFIENKPTWKLSHSDATFEATIKTVEAAANAV